MCTFNGEREVKVCDVAIGPVKAALGAGLGGEAVRYTHLEGEGTRVELTASEVDVRVFEQLVREGMAEAERADH